MNFKLDQGTQLITPNQRLAKHLLNGYKKNTLALNSSIKTLYRPNISSFDTWLQKQFEYLQEHFPFEYGHLQLLNTQQERFFWQEIINNSAFSENLLLKQGLINEVVKAHALTYAWNLNKKTIEDSHYFISLDQKSFLLWQESFEKICSQKHLIPSSQCLSLILKALDKNIIPLAEHYIFFGFDELTAQQAQLQNKLLALNKNVQNEQTSKKTASYQRALKCTDFEEEISLASEWAKSINETYKDAQIAIVIPSLSENRQVILNTFIKTLNATSYRPGNSIYPLSFNISSGVPLSNFPSIKSAMACIRLQTLNIKGEKIEVDILSNLIRSHFLLNTTLSKIEKHSIDMILKSSAKSELEIEEIIKLLKKLNPTISNPIIEIFTDKSIGEQLKTHLEWKNYFLQILENFQWLKGKQLDSESFQAVNKFIKLLNEFSKLDNYLEKCKLYQAISRFEDLIQNELFQAESIEEINKNIHILGTLEAAGQTFSHLWICEFNDKVWPSKAKPNSFIPLGLQNELYMPHSSAQRELDFSKKIIRRFQSQCEHIIYSFSESEKDETYNISPLIDEIEIIKREQLIDSFQLTITQSLEQQILKIKDVEYFHDELNLPISKEEYLKGGQGIIKNQAQCPFNAFSYYRLKIKKFEEAKNSLSAIDRGNILHKLMELFWQDLKNQEQLLKLNEEDIVKLLKEHSKKIKNDNKLDYIGNEIAFSLELNRAQEIALLFLNNEKQRENFEVVGFEVSQEQSIQELKLSLRVDRIDRLDDGSEIIIDYKSSNAFSSSWLPPRIDEPQLPIYLMNNPKAKAIAFAVLNKNAKEFGLKGIASRFHSGTNIFSCDDEKKNKKLPLTWDDLLQVWRMDIENQATQFIQGVNFVDPKKKNISCAYCDFSTICRINEITGFDETEDESEESVS